MPYVNHLVDGSYFVEMSFEALSCFALIDGSMRHLKPIELVKVLFLPPSAAGICEASDQNVETAIHSFAFSKAHQPDCNMR